MKPYVICLRIACTVQNHTQVVDLAERIASAAMALPAVWAVGAPTIEYGDLSSVPGSRHETLWCPEPDISAKGG